ncbi:ParB N-terminal domain-containing protein, partial [Christensenellaceae bacterium OttesenSCG-928-K19]|nr:ParB N-terminal domain-containing protein [Christensenellaceae bacterium OttesenSCG-928-K19]
EDGYEIISGHRRTQAAIDADMNSVPAIVEELDDDTATILMADSNLTQRTHILPSERAKAYKMKMEALKRQGYRTDKTSPQLAAKFRSDDEIGKDDGISGDTVQRFIDLNELIDPLLDALDNKEIKFTPAVELSQLKLEEQSELAYIMETEEVAPTLAQAKTLKELSQQGDLDKGKIAEILTTEKPIDYKVVMKGNELKEYFPPDTTPKEMKETLFKLLREWKRGREQEQEPTR